MEECVEFLGENYTEVLEANNLLNNLNCLLHAPTLTNAAIIKGYVLSIMTVLSLIGNFATIYSIRKSRRRRSGHFYTLLFHLAIADVFVTFWCILGDSIWYFTVEWKAGNVECKLFKFAQMTSLYISTFIMVLIGVDRFVGVRHPLKSMSKGKCFRLVIFCWFLSGLLSSPQIVVFNVLSGPFQEPFYQCVTYGSYKYEWQEQLYTIFTIVFTFVIPLIILATTYIRTVCTLHSNENFLESTSGVRSLIDSRRRSLMYRAKMRSFKISIAIVITFVVCWTPYYVAMIYTFINRKNDQEMKDPDSIVFTAIFFFGVSNSLCNPIIYGYFHLWKPRRKDSSKKTFLTNTNDTFQESRFLGLASSKTVTIKCHIFRADCSQGTNTNPNLLRVPSANSFVQLMTKSTSEENTLV